MALEINITEISEVSYDYIVGLTKISVLQFLIGKIVSVEGVIDNFLFNAACWYFHYDEVKLNS